MMQPSYRQLIADHEEIERLADGVLADIPDGQVSAGALDGKLRQLATVISDHIEVEDGIIGSVDHDRLSGPWSAAWGDGTAAFLVLKADWIRFLGAWDEGRIASDRPGFADAAQTIFARIRERLSIETRALYATALQTGSIALR